MKTNNFYTVRGYSMKDDNPLTPSMEDYLEMIYRLCEESGFTRTKELSDHLNVRASSCTKIIQKIALEGFLLYERYGMIQLTEKGKEYGAYLLLRHEIVEDFLRNMGIKENLLMHTELMEHHISPQLLKELKQLNEFFKDNPNMIDALNTYKNKKG